MKNKKKELHQRISNLEQTVSKLQQSIVNEHWLDAHDVKTHFNISDSTLWRYRKADKIPYSKMGNKFVYPQSFFTLSLKKKMINSHLL